MPYDTKELEERALKVIKSKKLIFIEDISVMMGINKTTFYAHRLHENDEIMDEIIKNKINIRNGLRDKWYHNDNATTQLALYKLAAIPKELERLTMQKIDQKIDGEIKVVKWLDEV